MSDDRPKRETMSSKKRPSPTCGRLRLSWKYLNEGAFARSKTSTTSSQSSFRSKTLHAGIPDTVFPEPYLLTETENKIIDDVLDLLNKQGLTSRQSMKLLERLGGIIGMGQWWRRGQRTK